MSESINPEDYIKVILLGESGVGKTNLINVSQGKEFDYNSMTSLSSSYSNGTLVYKDKEYLYVLWDTAGQESYRSLNKIFMKNSKVIIFVFSLDNKRSFDELDYWIDNAKNEVGVDCVMGIAGNKCDLIKEQVVNEADAEKYADDHGMKIRFTSALNNPYGFKSYLNELIIDYINFDKNDDIKDKKKKEVVVLKTGNKESKNKNKKRKC